MNTKTKSLPRAAGQAAQLSQANFASEEAIERNYQRLKKIGDTAETLNMFEAFEASGADLPLFQLRAAT
jgi:hypothetical protein